MSDTSSARAPWIISLKASKTSDSERFRILCFPPAGGNPYFFSPLTSMMPDNVALAVVSLPGRPPRMAEAPAESFDVMVENVVRELRAAGGISRTLLLGHSMGAHLAFRVALELVKDSAREPERPLGVVVSSAAPPAIFFEKAKAWAGRSDAQLIDALRSYGAAPEQILNLPDREELFLSAYRGDCEACARYDASAARVPVRLLVLGGRSDPHVAAEELYQWSELSTGDCRVVEYPGDHFYLADRWEEILDHCLAFFSPNGSFERKVAKR